MTTELQRLISALPSRRRALGLLTTAGAMPLALLAFWIGLTLLVRAWRVRKGGSEEDR